jgi:beta-galactosidase
MASFTFGAAYYPEHRNPAKWDHDLALMASAHLNCLRVGEFAWARFEPQESKYDLSWMDTFCEKAARHGIRLLLCLPLRTAPAWLVEKDPTILIEREDGVRLEFGSRYTFCINHPLLREKGARLAEEMARHFGRNDNVAGWHLDNEHGDEPDCHCPICRKKFQAWCEKRYDTIERLNERWGLAFWGLELNHFAQVPTPRATKTFHGPGHLLAWRRFRSECTIEAVALQANALRPCIAESQFITTNNQSWNQRTDYYRMAQHLDVTGINHYPGYGCDEQRDASAWWGLAACRGYRGKNFQVHELRNGAHMTPGRPGNTPAPGEVERLTMHCVANGADATFYFRWRACPFGCEQAHGTITDYDGRPKRVYEEVERVGGRLARLSALLDGTTVHSEVAVLHDFGTWWVMGTGVGWNGPKELYLGHCKKLHHALRRQRVNCDVIGPGADFAAYRLLAVPSLATIDDALADRLVAFVKGGGTLVWHPFCGIKDVDAQIFAGRLHPGLKDLLGVDVTEFATAGQGKEIPFTWRGQRYSGALFCDLPVLEGAQADGEFVDAWFAGTPAVAVNSVGEGRVIYVMTYAEPAFYENLFDELCDQADVRRILDGAIPKEIEVAERSADDGRRLTFLLNSGARELTVSLPAAAQDVYSDEPVEGAVTLRPFGVHILSADGIIWERG